MDKRSCSRRHALKSLGIVATGLASAGTVAGSPDGDGGSKSPVDAEPLDPETYEPLHPDVSEVHVGQELKSLTRHWPLLAASDDVVFGHLAETGYSDRRADEASDALKELRRKYPVTQRTKNGDTYLNLASESSRGGRRSHGGRTGSTDRSTAIVSADGGETDIAEVATVVNDGLARSRGERSVDVQWKRGHHDGITWLSASAVGVSSTYRDGIKENARQPDIDDYSAPDWTSGFIGRNYFKKTIHSEKHYYNPDMGLGRAPKMAKQNMQAAESELDVSHPNYDDWEDAYNKTAYASHYVADCAQPLHTGMEYQQAGNYAAQESTGGTPIHHAYAKWAMNDVWGDVKSDFENGSHFDVLNLDSATKDLADASHKAETVYWTIYNTDNWRHDYNLEQITENRLQAATLYIKGMFNRLRS
ncbi:hypothetical protein [Haloarcula pellucida]|uniref:Phospholipase C n=1 Tax=Haloarcula pellucida TaxID=1427151 RepID=A0A830GPU8_9EURY|nr:hypothetical protein [Halomicroarcula pellucida]MBX0349192.1 hypothetical protein [Halomicroarcula pellucida]GGN99446.1 hypothetical protein GCM10009030_30990 [Halomicroarcula pellucida]